MSMYCILDVSRYYIVVYVTVYYLSYYRTIPYILRIKGKLMGVIYRLKMKEYLHVDIMEFMEY